MGKIKLFSFGVATDRWYSVNLTKDGCQDRDSVGRVKLTGSRSANDVYFVHVTVRRVHAHLAIGSLQLWHQLLAHVSQATITDMARRNLVDGMQITGSDDTNFFCDG